MKDHIEAVHHTEGPVLFDIVFFEQMDTNIPPAAASSLDADVPSAPSTDDDNSMDTDDAGTSEDPSAMATDDDGYAGGLDFDVASGLEEDEEDAASDAPSTEQLWFSRGRQPHSRLRTTPYTRSTSESASRGRRLARRPSEPSSALGFGQLHIQTTSSRPHSPAMVAPSPLGRVAYSRPNSKSPTDDDSSDNMAIDDNEPDLGFMDEAATLNMASLRMIPLLYLRMMPTALLVVCTQCEVALVSQSAVRHSRTEHSIVLSKDQKRSIEDIIRQPGIISSPAETIPPKPPCAPIEGLARLQGLSCNFCNYCCIADSSVRAHIREKHHGAGGKSMSNFTPATLQAFSSQNRKYFAVVPVLSDMPQGNLFQAYLEQHAPQIASLQLINPPLDHLEVPPLLVVTGWHTHLAPYTGDRTKVRVLRELMQLPTSTKGVAWMGERLRKTIEAYVKDVTQKGNNADLELRCVLMECPRLGLRLYSSSGQRPLIRVILIHRLTQKGDFWIPLPENTAVTYARLLHQWTHALLLTLEGHPSSYKFPLTNNDKDHASALKDALVSHPDRLHIDLFHEFIKPLLYPKDHSSVPGPYSKFNEPFECFYALTALREDGNFQPAQLVTQVFAKMEYFVRGTILYAGLKASTGDIYA